MRRYVGADDWEGLLRRFAEETPRPYEYYRTTASSDLPAIASEIAAVFHDQWWTEDRYADSRERWGDRLKGRESALKVEVASFLSGAKRNLPTAGDPLFAEVDLLRRVVVDGVITTNFDDTLEEIFDGYRVFVGQEELLFASPQGVGEIYKVHGSCTNPDSLVLTADDYHQFDSRNAILAAKLMTIFVEHPVIFLGYSLSDRNIQSILRAITACLSADTIESLQDNLIFVSWSPESQATLQGSTMMLDDLVLGVTHAVVPDFSDIYGVLGDLSRVFPARMLRQLKEQVYELVRSDDPHERLHVADMDGDVIDDVDVVFGVGIKAQLGHQGYLGISRFDLLKDVLQPVSDYQPERIVNDTLSSLARQPGYFPVFRYLREGGFLTKAGKVRASVDIPGKLVERVAEQRGALPVSKWHTEHQAVHLDGISDFAALAAKGDPSLVCKWALYLPPSKVRLEDLRTFLIQHEAAGLKDFDKTQHGKLVCYYDWLAYGRSVG